MAPFIFGITIAIGVASMLAWLRLRTLEPGSALKRISRTNGPSVGYRVAAPRSLVENSETSPSVSPPTAEATGAHYSDQNRCYIDFDEHSVARYEDWR